MSVINTMLRELDKRQGRPGGEAAAGDALRPVKPAGTKVPVRTWLLGVGAGAAVAFSAWSWMEERHPAAVIPAPPVPVIAKLPTASAYAASAASAASVASSGASSVAQAQAQARGVAATSATAASSVTPTAPVVEVAASGPVAVQSAHAASAAGATPSATAVTSAPRADVEAARPRASAPSLRLAGVSAKPGGGKSYSPKQVSANLLGQAMMLDQEGRMDEAIAPLRRALGADPQDLQARQMLIRLELDKGHFEEARVLLAEGRRLHPELPEFTMALARLNAETGDGEAAIQLLQAGLRTAHDDAQYHGLLAALLVRAQRFDEAVPHYLLALRSDPANGNWLVGVGVALEAVGRPGDAAEAYRRADATSSLTAEMAAFVVDRIARLGSGEGSR